MLFNSYAFLVLFLPVVLVGARALRGQRLLGWVSAASCVFYAFAGHAWFLIPMAFTTVLDFAVAPLIERATSQARRRLLLVVSLCGNLGLLAYFKYGGLFARTVDEVFLGGGHGEGPAWLELFRVVLPAGISFYTFQTLSYIIDVYRGQCPAERNFLKFAGFVTFFPHLVAGPLTRHNQLIPALEHIAERGVTSRWKEGVFLFAVGLAKKTLIADRVAQCIDPSLSTLAPMDFFTAWTNMIGYAVQIYFDFSGYSDMAIGLGRLFGVELPQNFNSPYQARNPSDFWRRWHITLSLWLRDYLYISLGGNRCGEARRHLNLVATMVLGGLWHGASWTFAAWGLFHGLLLVVYHACQRPWDALPLVVQRGVTFLLVCLAWVLFRAETFEHATVWYASLAGLHGFDPGSNDFLVWRGLAYSAVALVIANACAPASSYARFEALKPAQQVGLGVLTAAALVFMSYSSRFLYFQF